MSYEINHYLNTIECDCGQTGGYFGQAQICYTSWAAGGDEDFPINARKAFPRGTWGQILAMYCSSAPQIAFVFSQISLP